MSNLLKQTLDRPNPLSIKDLNAISKIKISPSAPSIIHFNSGDSISSSCLRCPNTPCCKFSESELTLKALSDFSYDRTDLSCPVDAISIDIKHFYPIINKSKCINCGLCAYRCPTSAIYMGNEYAIVNHTIGERDSSFYYTLDTTNFYNDLEKILKIEKDGVLIAESDMVLDNVYTNILKLNKKNNNLPNMLVRNILLSIGTTYNSTRTGDNNFRMDGIIGNSEHLGVCEIEFGSDLLNSPRNILDDIAVICSRYSKEFISIYPLIVSLELPNTRSEYWRVIQDINNVLGIKINSISIGALLLLLWNFQTLDITTFNFYSDCDNLSIRGYIQNILDRDINLGLGFKSILEVNK